MYDDRERQNDAHILMARTAEEKNLLGQNAMHGALCVFLLDPKLRQVLDAIDPKAVEQARRALGLV
jgi:hypothetical protein